MDSLPVVSIITPVYNASPYLRSYFRSVLAQTYPGPIEVSLYDDASTDGSAELVQDFARQVAEGTVQWPVEGSVDRFSVVCAGSSWDGTAAVGQGCGVARNHAVAQSTGEYLCILDAGVSWFGVEPRRCCCCCCGSRLPLPPDDMAHPARIAIQVYVSIDSSWVWCPRWLGDVLTLAVSFGVQQS